MPRRKLPPEQKVEGGNLTPLIDVVFQLLVFFMLVMDMSKAEIEALTLPLANKATKEQYSDPLMLLINIRKDGTVKIGGRTFWKPSDKHNCQKIEDLFEQRRQNRKYQENPGDDQWVKYPILIRADRSTHFEHVQKILMIATKHGGVTRVRLGAKIDTEG